VASTGDPGDGRGIGERFSIGIFIAISVRITQQQRQSIDFAIWLDLAFEFWFTVKIKDSVERRERTKTKAIFHADVVGVGLY
jgi:hypothetical protein